MRGIFRSLVLVALIGLAAHLTRPSEDAAEATLKDMVIQALAEQEIDPARGAGGNLALGLCKLDPNECYKVIRSGIEATYSQSTFHSQVQIAGFGKTASCYGMFTKFICPGGLRDG